MCFTTETPEPAEGIPLDDARQEELEAVQPATAQEFCRYMRSHAEVEFGDEFILPDDQAQQVMLDVSNFPMGFSVLLLQYIMCTGHDPSLLV